MTKTTYQLAKEKELNAEGIEVGWVLYLRPHNKGDKTHPCIWAGLPTRCDQGCRLDSGAYGRPIAIVDKRSLGQGDVELDFVSVSTQNLSLYQQND